MGNSEYILKMKNITKRFSGVVALSGVSLKLRPATVHALMGENGAGKSTLMKCLFGIYHKDEGEIFLNGENVHFNGTMDAIEHGISMIHQELYPQRFLSVMENVWVGRLPVKHGLVDYKAMYEKTQKLLKELDINLDPKAKVGDLSVSQMQCVEIVRAVSFNSKVIIMDEPTSSLTDNEVEHLFKIIARLKAKGVAFIYISHPYVISVRRFGSLPASIFFFSLTSGFLQIPPHDGHPCLRLTLPTAERVVVSHHLVVALAGRTGEVRQRNVESPRQFCQGHFAASKHHVQLNADHGEIPPLSFAFFLLYVMMLLLASPFRRKKRPCWTAGFLEHLVLAHMRTFVCRFGQKKYSKIVGSDEYT